MSPSGEKNATNFKIVAAQARSLLIPVIVRQA